MGKVSRDEMSLIKKEGDELLKLILKKSGMSYNRFLDISKREFVIANLDMVTEAEKKRFKHIAL